MKEKYCKINNQPMRAAFAHGVEIADLGSFAITETMRPIGKHGGRIIFNLQEPSLKAQHKMQQYFKEQ